MLILRLVFVKNDEGLFIHLVMTDFDPINPLMRPKTPERTSWFEFLLDANLLEKHLTAERTGIIFIYLNY